MGFTAKRPGDADALALSAAKLVRIAAVMILAQADLMEQLHHPLAFRFALGELVDFKPLADNIADPHARVERGVWVLKNNLHFAAHVAQFALRHSEKILTLKNHLAAGGLDQTQDRSPQGRFAAARLSDQTDGFALIDGQVDAVDGFDSALVAREIIRPRPGNVFLGCGFLTSSYQRTMMNRESRSSILKPRFSTFSRVSVCGK